MSLWRNLPVPPRAQRTKGFVEAVIGGEHKSRSFCTGVDIVREAMSRQQYVTLSVRVDYDPPRSAGGH